MAAELTSKEEVELLVGGPLEGAEEQKVAAWIVTATALIRQAVPTVDARMSSGALDPALVHAVATDMVHRALQADRIGFRVRSESFPEVTTQYRDTDEPPVFLLEYERALLAPPAPARRGAFSIRPQEAS